MKKLTIVLSLPLLLLTGCSLVQKNDSQLPTASTGADSSQVERTDLSPQTGQLLAGNQAKLYDFTKAAYDQALASDKLVLLYFYANWCPICKQETSQALYPAFNELTTDQVVGFRINFKDGDTDSDEMQLARDYDVPYQHFKVLLKNNQVLLTSPESWTKERYLEEINQLL